MFDINVKKMREFFDLKPFTDFFSPVMSNHFKIDIKETGTGYEFIAEVPGIKKEDINVTINGDLLTIQIHKKDEVSEENLNYIRKERYFGTMSRSFSIPNVDEAGIKATYQNGILKITVPKLPETAQHKQIPID